MGEMWMSIEDLLAEAEKVNEERIDYRGRALNIKWKELRLEEAPSVSEVIGERDMTEELTQREMMEVGERLTEETVFRMIVKGQSESGEKPWTKEQWARLPVTLRRDITNRIMLKKGENDARF